VSRPPATSLTCVAGTCGRERSTASIEALPVTADAVSTLPMTTVATPMASVARHAPQMTQRGRRTW